MKKYCLGFLLIVMIACSTNKTGEQSAADRTQVSADTLSNQKAEEALPAINPAEAILPAIPKFKEESLTGDSLETSLAGGLTKLVKQSSKDKYVVLKARSVSYYSIGNDVDESTTAGSANEDKKWYFNLDGELTIYTEEKSNANEDVAYQRGTTIYLFKDNQLKAAYKYSWSDGQMFYETVSWSLASSCPSCGVMVSNDGDGSLQLSTIDQTQLTYLSEGFFKAQDKLLLWFRKSSIVPATSKEGVLVKRSENIDGTSENIEYSMPLSLYKRLIAGR